MRERIVEDFEQIEYPFLWKSTEHLRQRIWITKSNIKEIVWWVITLESLIDYYTNKDFLETPYHWDNFSFELFSPGHSDFWWQYTYFSCNQEWVFVELYNDAPFLIWLKYWDTFVAFLWFEYGDSSVKVKQFQGAKFIRYNWWIKSDIRHNNFIKWFDWRKLLVHLVESFLNSKWFTWKIIIQSAKNNMWFQISCHCRPWERWYNTYDKTAIEMWYTGNEDDNYIKEV